MEVKPNTLVLHLCCAPCAVYPITLLENLEAYIELGIKLESTPNIICYFYNPNIYPIMEYDRRRDELIKYAKNKNINVVVEDEIDNDKWDAFIKGFENELEGKLRCEKCFEMRLTKTFEYAKSISANYVTTVLSISPRKNTNTINRIGKNIEQKYIDIEFLEFNFKKKDGFLKASKISKENNLYRQSYCGCKYSIRKT